MKLDNIIKKLRRNGFEVVEGEFSFQKCYMCNGTALVDLSNGAVADTSARYSDVVKQIQENRSHIITVECGKKGLARFNKMGY